MFSRVLLEERFLRRHLSRPVARSLALALAAGMVVAVPPAAQAAGRDRPGVQDLGGEAVIGRGTPVRGRIPNPAQAAAASVATVAWPAPGVSAVDVGAGALRAAHGAPSSAGGMPVAAAPVTPPVGPAAAGAAEAPGLRTGPAPSKLHLQTYPRSVSTKAGVDGPIVRVQRADTTPSAAAVKLTLGYAGFANAFGGDFGSRLRLVRLPDCALTTPAKAECRVATPIGSTNDTEADMVSAEVAAPAGFTGGLIAFTAGDSSSQGSYAATKLAPSSTWNVAPSSGAFNWSYPLRLPPTPGGLVPQVGFSYSSQSVDGRTAATNNQGSWIGEGFSYEPGYIERRYKPCPDDGHDSVADLCWAFDNATIMLNGASGELIKDASGRWRLTSDQDWRIEPLTGASNGDNNGEYWRITTPEGTEYLFGQNRLAGWTSGKEETNSAWTVPVYGDDSGEPCYQSTFADAWCQQAWRWNLDYVRDAHDNVTAYYYGRETNSYARGAKTDVNGTEYHRGGWLRAHRLRAAPQRRVHHQRPGPGPVRHRRTVPAQREYRLRRGRPQRVHRHPLAGRALRSPLRQGHEVQARPGLAVLLDAQAR